MANIGSSKSSLPPFFFRADEIVLRQRGEEGGRKKERRGYGHTAAHIKEGSLLSAVDWIPFPTIRFVISQQQQEIEIILDITGRTTERPARVDGTEMKSILVLGIDSWHPLSSETLDLSGANKGN